MRLTRRGIAAAFALLSLLFASILYPDFILSTAFLVVLVIVGAESLWVSLVVRRPSSRFYFETQETGSAGRGGTVLYPGEESVERVRFVKRAGGQVELETSLEFLHISPARLGGRTHDRRLTMRFATPYASEYSLSSIDAVVTGPLGLVSSRCSLEFRRKFSVYPRVLSVAAITLKVLGQTGIGETPINFPGAGTEFYEMRNYQSGDDFRRVNWKASARRGELVVNEHMREIGTSFLLMLDATAPGFADADRLATTFLSIANTLAIQGVRFGVIVHKGDTLVAEASDEDRGKSLRLALSAALDFTGLVPPFGVWELDPIRNRGATENEGKTGPAFEMGTLMKSEMLTVLQTREAWKAASDYLRQSSSQTVVYVTGLFGPVEPIMELAWQARHYRDIAFLIADPTVGLTGAPIWESHIRNQGLTRALAIAGIPCYSGDPLDIARRVFA